MYFKNKQSSLAVALLLSERDSNGLVADVPSPPWMHSFGSVVAFWIPTISSGGCGALHRSSPVMIIDSLLENGRREAGSTRTQRRTRVTYTEETGHTGFEREIGLVGCISCNKDKHIQDHRRNEQTAHLGPRSRKCFVPKQVWRRTSQGLQFETTSRTEMGKLDC